MANAWGNPTKVDLGTRQAQLQQQMQEILNRGGTFASENPQYLALRREYDAIPAQAIYANSQAAAGGNGGIGTAQSNWQNALKNTEGRGDAVMNDPYTQAALNRFQSVLGGQDVPYTQQVQNQLLARQADAGAASGAAQASMLRDSMAALGGSMADPQAQAAMRQIQAQLQQQNNANLGDMQSKATMANFGARNDAASNLAATRAGQLGMANSQYNQASQLYANQQLAGPHQSGVSSVAMPVANYNQDAGYAGPPAPYQPPAPQPNPQPQPQPRPNGGLYTNYVSNTGPAKPAFPNMSYGSNNWTTGQTYPAPQPAVQKNPYGAYNPNLPVY